MIESMTGYGKAIVHLPSKKLTIEIRTLNSKNLDIITRIPSEYKEKELEIRQKLAKNLVRGKVTFIMQIEQTGVESAVSINAAVVEKYIADLRKISAEDTNNLLEIAMRLPETVSSAKEEFDDSEWKIVQETIEEAINEIVDYRKTEGLAMEKDFRLRLKKIQGLLKHVEQLDGERKELMRNRLKKAIDELQQKVDENRFEQELIYYLEKLDINEEQVRLANHLDYFFEVLDSSASQGKKLGFIAQEMGREINTIGSKANFSPMQKVVIQMKDELEKIKEQNLNIL